MRFVVSRHGLEPFDAEARKFLATRIDGEPFEMEMLHARDMVEHRRIFGTINDLAKALGTSEDKVRAELLIGTGNFTLIEQANIPGAPEPRDVIAINSMSRRHMTDHELHAFWVDAQEVIKNQILPRIQNSALRDQMAERLSLEAA
jgi:hypothetical protein